MVIPKAKSRASSLLSLKKSEDAVFRKKVQKQRQEYRKEKQPRDHHGVICLSNIPHGFCENEIKKYFSQYGDVLRVKLVRSERTGESCGYGFVMFEHWEVANIVAKTINGYLTFGKIMKCRLLDNSRIPETLFHMSRFRQKNCPKMLIRKSAINKLNKVRSKKEDRMRIKKLKTAYRRKLRTLKGLGVSINLELPQVIKGSVSSKPEKLEKIKRTDEKASGEDIAQDGHHSGMMVIEVDQSDVEVQFKTPPNAVKKYMHMAPFKVTENTVAVKPISSVPKMNPKKEGATASLTENTLLDEEKNAAAGLANQDGNGALESIMPSSPLVTTNKKMAIKKKKKTVQNISKCKENTPLSTASDISLPKTTPVKRKQANNQIPAKNLLKKMKAIPSPASLDAQVVSVGKDSSTIRTPISSKSVSNGIDMSNFAQVTEDISQLSHVQTSEETQFSIASKKDTSTKRSKVTKKSVSPLTAVTKTPKKMQKLKKVLTPKTLQSNSLTPKLADLENATVFPESEITSPGTNTVEDKDVMENTEEMSHGVKKERNSSNYTETPKKVKHGKKLVTPKKAELESVLVFSESEIETSKGANSPKSVETVPEISHSTPAGETSQQVPQSSKKNKTLKKRESSNYIETPIKVKKVEKVAAPKTPDCNGLPPMKADSENVIVLSGSEIETSCKTDTSRSGEMVTNAPQLPLTVETPIKASEEMKLPLSTKKNKTPNTKTPKKTPKRQDSLEDTEIPKKVKEVQTPKTPACKSLPPKRAKSNIMVFSESEMTPLGANDTPRIVEAVTNSSQKQSSKKNKTPKRIKNMGFTETPKMV